MNLTKLVRIPTQFFLRRVTLIGALCLFWVVVTGFKVDPTDDFSFSFSRAPAEFRLMHETEVAVLLGDRLDVFPKSQSIRLARHIVKLCNKYRFDPAFVLSVIQVESGFRVRVVSSAGAVGLMQLIPNTAAVVAHRYQIRYNGKNSLVDPFTNVSIGIAYLSLLRDKYVGMHPYYSVAAYNIGPARLDELRSRKYFKPDKTLKYFEAIRNGLHSLRFHSKGRVGV